LHAPHEQSAGSLERETAGLISVTALQARGRPRREPTGGRVERSRTNTQQAKAKSLPWPVVLFLVGLIIPWVILVGPLRLSVYRIVLVAMIVPCLVIWMRGGAGRIRLPDIAVVCYCVWGTVCLAVVHGPTVAMQAGGILFIELGPALLSGKVLHKECR
jgi:hypothetical protein